MKNRNYRQPQFNLIHCIGKIDISKDTSPELVSALMKSCPDTVVIDGKYERSL